MNLLLKIEGPECPQCGCTDSVVVERHRSWTGISLTKACRCCGTVFAAAEAVEERAEDRGQRVDVRYQMSEGRGKEEAGGIEGTDGTVLFSAVHCPFCGSTETMITSAPKKKKGQRYRIRYHKCKNPQCGISFKSLEE